jgi:hypothetical protein
MMARLLRLETFVSCQQESGNTTASVASPCSRTPTATQPALEAVAREVITATPDLVVFRGDLTCGPLPEEAWQVALDRATRSSVGRSSYGATPSAR